MADSIAAYFIFVILMLSALPAWVITRLIDRYAPGFDDLFLTGGLDNETTN